MRNKLFTLIISIVLALTLCLTLVACGGKGNGGDTNTNQPTDTDSGKVECQHVWVTAGNEKEPSCDVAGEAGYTCTKCGASKTEEIPATGKHTYQNAVCVDCGKKYGECAHSELKIEKISLAEYGACGGGAIVRVCTACGTNFMDITESDPICTTMSSLTSDLNHTSYNCNDCGLCVALELVEGCCESYANIEVKVANTLVLEAVSSKQIKEDFCKNPVIDLGSTFSCGVEVVAFICDECGKVHSVRGSEHNGELAISVTEEEVDGVTYTTKTRECATCSFKETRKSWKNNCYIYTELKIYNGDKLLYESLNKEETENDHNYVLEYEMIGNSCQDGYFAIGECQDCGEEYAHAKKTCEGKRVTVDLTDLTSCGGQLGAIKCDVCGKYREISAYPTGCDFVRTRYEAVTDENGIKYDIIEETCKNCGLKITETDWEETINNCAYVWYIEAKITIDGEEAFTALEKREYVEHDYDITNRELLGTLCLDGVRETYICNDCGATTTSISVDEHKTEVKSKQTVEHGCGAVIEYYECLCGEEKSVNIVRDCEYRTSSEKEETVDGVKYLTFIYGCEDCELLNTVRTWEEDDGCASITYAETSLTYGETVILDKNLRMSRYETSNCEDEEIVVRYGEDCKEDGFFKMFVCKSCGDCYYEENYSHEAGTKIAYVQTDCGFYLEVYDCYCGKEQRQHHEMDWCDWERVDRSEPSVINGQDNEYHTFTCNNCGIVMNKDYVFTLDGCTAIRTETIKLTYQENGEEKEISVTTIVGEFDCHDEVYEYEFVGKSCEDGVTIKTTCKRCDFEEIEQTHEHEIRTQRTILGGCTGNEALYYTTCPCGEYQNAYVIMNDCNGVDNDYSEEIDGVYHEIYTYTCVDCGLCFKSDSYSVVDGCYIYKMQTISVTRGEEVVVEAFEYLDDIYADHNYESSYKLKGESCEDGVDVTNTCRYCGAVSMEDYYEHRLIEDLDLSLDTECQNSPHDIYLSSCMCGEEYYANYDYYGLEYDEATGKYECPACDYILYKNMVDETKDCQKTTKTTFKVTNGEEILFEKTYQKITPFHELEVKETASIQNGIKISYGCKDCDLSYTSVIRKTLLEGNENVGYEYVYEFTPEKSGVYTVYGISENDTLATLYGADGTWLAENDDSGVGSNFLIEYELEAGVKYKYVMKNYYGDVEDFYFVVVEGTVEGCPYYDSNNGLLLDATITEKSYVITICNVCNIIVSFAEKTKE